MLNRDAMVLPFHWYLLVDEEEAAILIVFITGVQSMTSDGERRPNDAQAVEYSGKLRLSLSTHRRFLLVKIR